MRDDGKGGVQVKTGFFLFCVGFPYSYSWKRKENSCKNLASQETATGSRESAQNGGPDFRVGRVGQEGGAQLVSILPSLPGNVSSKWGLSSAVLEYRLKALSFLPLRLSIVSLFDDKSRKGGIKFT